MIVVAPPDRLVVAERQAIAVVRRSVDSVAVAHQRESAGVVRASVPQFVAVNSGNRIAAVLAAGTQGPPGVPGQSASSEEDMPYAKRTDFVGDVIYKAKAAPGSQDNQPVWQIERMTILSADGDSESQWPAAAISGSDVLFNQVWDDHLTLEYV